MASETALMRREAAKGAFLDEIRRLEDEAQATAFGQECLERQRADEARSAELARQQAENATKDRKAHVTIEVAQPVASVLAGGISTLRVGSFPIGTAVNYTLGGVSKIGSIQSIKHPQKRVLRVVSAVSKELLHCQMAIDTRRLINGS